MKVRTAFDFSDAQLRTIRAAHGRGGIATRKESVIFIARAVEAALKAAPEAKPARRRVAKPLPPPPAPPPTADEEAAAAKARRDAIRRLYLGKP